MTNPKPLPEDKTNPVKSRSAQRRIAAQKGGTPPVFDSPEKRQKILEVVAQFLYRHDGHAYPPHGYRPYSQLYELVKLKYRNEADQLLSELDKLGVVVLKGTGKFTFEGLVRSQKEQEKERRAIGELKEALEDMVWQFAYRGVKGGKSILYTGGMSALEGGFEALGWDDPKYFEDMEGICDVKGCAEWTSTGGGAWADTGYWCLCSEHYRQAHQGKPQPAMKERAIKREASRDPVTKCLPFKRGDLPEGIKEGG